MRDTTRAFLRSRFPRGLRAYRYLRDWRDALTPPPTMTAIFSEIHATNAWGDAESVSGRGSTLARTAIIRSVLPVWLESVGAGAMLDAACGDNNWIQHVDLGRVRYIGVDVVPQLIARNRQRHESGARRFMVLDLTRDDLPRADVILCRDCFIHLSFAHIRSALANFRRSGAAFLIASTHAVEQNADGRTGPFRPINLCRPPFCFPQPLQLAAEDAGLGKYLGLWRLDDLPIERV